MSTAPAARSRDADDTRRRLLEAGRRRFARDGYTGSTVRDIAADAGVNVALINRYFDSKEGLFEACLRQVVADLDQPVVVSQTVDQAVERIVSQLVDLPGEEPSLQLLLLLRSSGDPGADQVRRQTLASFAHGVAAVGGRDATGCDEQLLRAQLILSAVLGMALLRSTSALEPLSSASADELRGPVQDLVSALLEGGD